MAGEWIETTIGDIADVYGGSTPSTRDPENFDGDVPWLTPKDLSVPHPRYVRRGERNLSQKGLRSCSAQLLPTNTVLLSSRAPIGYVAIAANPIATNQGFRSLLVKPEHDHEFVYYWLVANVEELERHASGSTFKEISGTSLKRIRVRIPARREDQRAIAHILGTLDDKIENLRRQNETLEAMARALFKAWFVDFEPVRAKIEGRWQRGQSLPGLPAHLYDLFPDRLVDSELGEIPEGWRHSTIGEEVTVCGGSTPSTKEPEFWEGGQHCWATPKDLSALKFPVLLDTDRKITDAGLAKISSGLLPVGTVLLSSRAPIGYLAITEVPTAINQGFIAMKCDGVLPNVFVLLWCRESMDAIVGNANGSTFQEISKSNFRPLRIIVPPDPVLKTFTRSAAFPYRQLAANERESRTLAQLRDTLLPKLISGELRVRDAEAFLKEHGL
ncbi:MULTISPECIES: restriction endonuclease subunit S [Methylococcus]|uniref:Restriction endonuclease subunit S n=1 Tax=Methylococcus capsulatus TaxID=414 RepID=A0ABZ2F548_METCP|nr:MULTISPECIES: restriction endonuclease subunit S [Methylococcus]MDF9392113.1 restriction endonuclease subunit S [Methylococcus capsulatus]